MPNLLCVAGWLIVGVSCASAAEATATPANASATFTLGFLKPEIGDDGTWNKYVFEDAYVIENKADPEAYFALLSEEPVASGWGAVSIEARFSYDESTGGLVGPALVYASDPQAGDLIVYNFLVDGTVNLYRFGDEGLSLLASARHDDIEPESHTFHTYELREGPSSIELAVNGEATGLRAPYDPAAPVALGLATFGIGSYEFRNFAQDADFARTD